MPDIRIEGSCDEQFSAVAQSFEHNFIAEGDIGASFSVFRDGRKVVDLWGGYADAARSRPWESDTIVNVWSTTKGMMALCVARLAGQGSIGLGRPVADYWPEFAENGKEAVTVAQLFSHQAGLCGPDDVLTEAQFLDTDYTAALLARQKPHWPVGTRSGYHALSIGPLADGLFKRVVGKTVGEYFRDEIADPLHVDFHMGLPESEDRRVAEMVHSGQPISGGVENYNGYQRLAQVHMPQSYVTGNSRAWRAQGMPSAAGHGNGRSIATIYSALATDRRIEGVEIVTEEALHEVTQLQIENEDLVLRFPMTWGIGFGLNAGMKVYGPNGESFGHHGWGGSFGFADPVARLGVGYAMNFMREATEAPDPRLMGLIGAVYASL
jgi:CubicO group peptidase (beta-lactamase class C family)